MLEIRRGLKMRTMDLGKEHVMRRAGLVVAVVLLLGGGCVEGKFVVEKTFLSVTSPEEMKGTYETSMGNFGIPQYGGTLVGNVLYPIEGRTGCASFGSLSFKSASPGGYPSVVLVDRGDCYFAKKVYNAQLAGAAAVLVGDDKAEPLITMDSPEEDNDDYVDNITVPSALIDKQLSDDIKKALTDGKLVSVKLDWRESLPHPDERVEYEFWTNSNDECGPKCDAQVDFVKNFKGVAQILEKGGYTLFTPHYITWYCPQPFIKSQQCKSQCINQGKYCAPDPEQDFSKGYEGKDVVAENLRQLCVFKVSSHNNMSWTWWDYVTDFHIRCPMKDGNYSKECSEQVMKSLGIPVDKIRECVGNPDADEENPVLKAEQDSQVGQGTRGDVTILPTLVVNNRQYRGKLDKGAVLKALCSGFQEATDPPPCLSEEVQTNECLNNNGGCWQNSKANVTACKDTFRGRVCSCPVVEGVQFQGDGYNACDAVGPGRCKIDNGGCWKGSQGTLTASACIESHLKGCECPPGFRGDGVNQCVDVDECKEKTACQCSDCKCSNKWGDYSCECQGDLLYIREHDTCISKKLGSSRIGWTIIAFITAGLAVAGVGAYVVYKYRLRSYMDSEIRAIMAQYMPLDSQTDIHERVQVA